MSYFSGLVKSTLSRVVSGQDQSFPYVLKEKDYDYEGASIWSLHEGVKKADNSPVSIFAFDCVSKRHLLPLARNHFKRVKTLRHPDLIRYLDGIETEEYIYIVTDPIFPLSQQLKATNDSQLLFWGFYKIANAVKFLNTDCNLVHGNIRVNSIFTNKAGEWKLGGFELLSSIQEESPFIVNYGELMPDFAKYATPEIKKHSPRVIKDYGPGVTDSWQYGCMIYEAFNGDINYPEQIYQRGSIPMNLFNQYKSLLAPEPRGRLSLASFIDGGLMSNGYFQNELIQINLFLENFAVKEASEKEAFFKGLQSALDKLPQDFCKYKILPELSKALEFGSGGPRALGLMMKIGEYFDDKEFEAQLLPTVVKMFSVTDRTIRLSLLENLGSFIKHLDKRIVNDKIFPHFASGFTDSVPVLREQTLRAVLMLIPKLSDRVINNDLMRYLAKLQIDEQPGIRTNTIICLGKIASSLNDSNKKNALGSAFVKSLRDPFPHARMASLMALSATVDYYEPAEKATKIIPCISSCLLDSEKIVRDQAFKAIGIFIKKLEAVANSMPDTTVITASAPKQAQGGNSQEEGWAGWAVSSITKKITDTIDSNPNTESSSNSQAASPSTPAPHSEPVPCANTSNMATPQEGGFGGFSSTYSSYNTKQGLANPLTPEPYKEKNAPVSATMALASMKLQGPPKPKNTSTFFKQDPWDMDTSGWDEDFGGDWDNDNNNWGSSAMPPNKFKPLTPTNVTQSSQPKEANQKREERRTRLNEQRDKKKPSSLGARRM
ncbi:ARM repeat-containing protein [Basidiobolus meristosporus CBS 931.73]|uniref:ARM repeat-containing protein n=1 Tax=Basidiobolus meristosporus CBS 931.73 TaxID=1314790 RepID=A0A1Y1XWR9_9FUNG|nr:ARM repeat-containing protein [Basidiobolus meristosporus CBS 931.73]|eukprot:ORX90168.1 ARM repeat-containing protein [Basidiobolus meristosporus CBS 931.73]